MINERTLATLQEVPGMVGPFFDDLPAVTRNRVRPFIWAFLLLRGAVRRDEVAGALAGHVSEEDQRIWDDPLDRTPLEVAVDDELAEMTLEGTLRVNGDLYVLDPRGLRQAVSLTCSLNAQLPDHLLQEAGR